MGKKLREAVEGFAFDPTPKNRDTFHYCLLMSTVYVPNRRVARQSAPGSKPPSDPMTSGPNNEPMLLVYTDGTSALREPGVTSAGGGPARDTLRKAMSNGVGVMVTTGHQKRAPRAVVLTSNIPALLTLGRMEDPVLGEIVWDPSSDDEDGFWRFEAGPVDGRSVAGVVVPETEWGEISSRRLLQVRKTVEWVRANDAAIRSHIATEMWDWWYNEYCDPPDRIEVNTAEQFRDKLELEVIRFEPDEDGCLVYEDHGMVCGYGIEIHVSPGGRFTSGPAMG
jgi:hypothetical protein